MEFGEFLSAKRKEKGYTVRKFADLIDISPSFLCDLENGDRPFPSQSKKTDLLEKMCKFLNLNNKEIMEFKKLADQSALKHNKLPNEISSYLLNNPLAQQALRKATDKKISDVAWGKVIDFLEKHN